MEINTPEVKQPDVTDRQEMSAHVVERTREQLRRSPLPNITLEILNTSETSWDSIKEDILAIEKEAFGDHGSGEEELKTDFENPNIVVLLVKIGNKIVGYTYADPNEDYEEPTAHICSTAFRKEYQGRGLVGPLIDSLEKELKKRGYQYITRYSAVENGYADKIAKSYKGRILETSDRDSEWGAQRFFRIKIK